MRIGTAVAGAATVGLLGAALTAPPAYAGSGRDHRQAAFTAAAREFGVPAPVLLAVSYQETRWEAHGGAPSTSGAYGPMALTDVPRSALGQRGDGTPPPDSPALHTARTAAGLIGAPVSRVERDDVTNIRAGAALLAHYAKALGTPGTVGGWYAAVARYSESGTTAGATEFADDVYGTITGGASADTTDGQHVRVEADPAVRPDTAPPHRLGLRAESATPKAECPRSLDCDYIPAAYQLNDPKDPQSYGNYDVADRPKDERVDTIVLHDTEETYADTIDTFTNPAAYVSAHYVVRSGDGHVTQMVPTKDVAWQAGNWYINSHSVGIEQEGFAIAGATWYTERLYHSTSTLVRYLSARYGVPLDRQHIIGHDNVPATSTAGIPAMHWDPGPFWDWNHFMTLLGRPTVPSYGNVVTIAPRFADNVQQVTDCEQHQPVAAQASSFVWLRTAPSPDAPLFSDPGLHKDGAAGTDCAADWGDKASAGQQFVVADRKPGWTAIWYAGAKAWFADRGAGKPTETLVVRPKHDAVATYGVAYPDASEYPSDIPAAGFAPLPYTIGSGQSYVYGGPVATDYYYAKTIDNSLPDDHTVVRGHQRYLRIQLGHRIAFVRASDVVVTPA
ncbi:N-acetylmuramoyl-L-alanine amidase [Actinocatenispora rupis]|uniref:N-acetylmuramoyl-L-alanine amidase n=1 Tax=Actinocatenispora rupis TaxID=519421 RepID=A0A8J3J8X9_9ACTN|nr:N-acetylmuramoyl-L-alanine amidase [Actinocatenispora rupis]GID14050.1 amidase [Actinocatenispora rupis]